jgi:hypothetical protein
VAIVDILIRCDGFEMSNFRGQDTETDHTRQKTVDRWEIS